MIIRARSVPECRQRLSWWSVRLSPNGYRQTVPLLWGSQECVVTQRWLLSRQDILLTVIDNTLLSMYYVNTFHWLVRWRNTVVLFPVNGYRHVCSYSDWLSKPITAACLYCVAWCDSDIYVLFNKHCILITEGWQLSSLLRVYMVFCSTDAKHCDNCKLTANNMVEKFLDPDYYYRRSVFKVTTT